MASPQAKTSKRIRSEDEEFKKVEGK